MAHRECARKESKLTVIKVKLVQRGEHEYTYSGEDADAILDALGNLKPGDATPSELYDVTDMDRSDADVDEYLTITDPADPDDDTVLWEGWLGGVDAPPPAGRDALEQLAAGQLEAVLAAIDKFESDLGFTAPELTGMRIEQLRGMVRGVFEPDDDDEDDAADEDEDEDGPGSGGWQQQRAADAAYWGAKP